MTGTYFFQGREIDAFARKPLWDVGLVYRHGTGHGIGAYLSVHEGLKTFSLNRLLYVSIVSACKTYFFVNTMNLSFIYLHIVMQLNPRSN